MFICLNQTRNRIYILCLCESNVWDFSTVSNKAALNTFQRHSAKHAFTTCGWSSQGHQIYSNLEKLNKLPWMFLNVVAYVKYFTFKTLDVYLLGG